jgi:hypothetical protein
MALDCPEAWTESVPLSSEFASIFDGPVGSHCRLRSQYRLLGVEAW